MNYKPQVKAYRSPFTGEILYWLGECRTCNWRRTFNTMRTAFRRAEEHADGKVHGDMLLKRMKVRRDLRGFPSAVQESLDRD